MQRIRLVSLIVLFIIGGFSMRGQDFIGKVTLEELLEEKDFNYPEANATILKEEGKIHFEFVPNIGFKMIKKVSRKIKVYNKEGFSSVDLVVPYFKGNGVKESVKVNEVNTYNAIEGKIVRSKIKSNAIFDDKKNEKWMMKKAIVPDVKEGSIVEYVYTIESDYLSVIPEWSFQKEIPIRHSKYEVITPENLVYATRLKGALAISITTDTRKRNVKVDNTDPLREVELKETVRVYQVFNVNPLITEPFVDNIENYRTGIQFDLSIINYPNRETKKISLSESDLVESIWSNKYFVSELKQTKYFENILRKDDFEGLSVSDKAFKVLELVKKQVVWNNKNGYFTDIGVKKAFETKIGNTADINLMLTAMLNYVGLEAYPVLISTVENGIDISLQKTSFNRVISCFYSNGGYYFLDGTSKYSGINIMPTNNLNWEGIVIKGKGVFDKVSMIPHFPSVLSESFILNLNEEGVGEGLAMVEFGEYAAYGFRNNFKDKEDEFIKKELEKGYNNIEIQNSRIIDKEDVKKKVNIRLSFKKKDMVMELGGELYFNPMQFYGLKSNPFSAENRIMPITFRIPNLDIYKVSFSIPKGYEIAYLPENLELKDGEIGFGMIYRVEQRDNKILFSFQFSKISTRIGVENYSKVRMFYDKMLGKIEEQIILKKI